MEDGRRRCLTTRFSHGRVMLLDHGQFSTPVESITFTTRVFVDVIGGEFGVEKIEIEIELVERRIDGHRLVRVTVAIVERRLMR